MNTITISGKGEYGSILFAKGEGREIYYGSRGNGLEDLTPDDFSRVSMDDLDVRKIGDTFYEFFPTENQGST
ncbi:MAG: hypothetical protein ABIJ20_03845 [Nanoarchaeota archaeon]|nr:hypothetical protein [Nanoarchaeota archaeon]MBU1445514.1 hypothetical protein [Nanoarchaeota archaeon]MBU2406999.1 hypothetical protein [Nanoarchaeota archaeon]MBU2420613.1 hypothetical protein [Nanoarchaeota archaeon]MBU2474939.1 hypothetical protein [Nanoarchaeota archaeon]